MTNLAFNTFYILNNLRYLTKKTLSCTRKYRKNKKYFINIFIQLTIK